MKISVLSKRDFELLMRDNQIDDETVESYKNVFFISINDAESSPYHCPSVFKHDHENVKVLYFDDVESENETFLTDGVKLTPFSKDMAEDLYRFISRNVAKSQCVIHCSAGISRSGAVATVVADMTDSFEEMKRDNPQICPNQRVIRLLNDARRNDENL